MSSEPESFLARWSRRKRTAEHDKEQLAKAVAPETPAAPPLQDAAAPPQPAAVAAPSHGPAATPEVPLPPIETLDGLRSDYQAFFQQPVADDLRNAALRKLFADPHFNQMDMLDVYVDDYTQFEPLPAAMKLRLTSARDFLLDSERAALDAVETSASATGDAAEVPASPQRSAAPGPDVEGLSAGVGSDGARAEPAGVPAAASKAPPSDAASEGAIPADAAALPLLPGTATREPSSN